MSNNLLKAIVSFLFFCIYFLASNKSTPIVKNMSRLPCKRLVIVEVSRTSRMTTREKLLESIHDCEEKEYEY